MNLQELHKTFVDRGSDISIERLETELLELKENPENFSDEIGTLLLEGLTESSEPSELATVEPSQEVGVTKNSKKASKQSSQLAKSNTKEIVVNEAANESLEVHQETLQASEAVPYNIVQKILGTHEQGLTQAEMERKAFLKGYKTMIQATEKQFLAELDQIYNASLSRIFNPSAEEIVYPSIEQRLEKFEADLKEERNAFLSNG